MALENWYLTHPFGVGPKNLNVIYIHHTGGSILDLDGEPTWPTTTDGTEARFIIESNTTASLWQLIASTHVDSPSTGWKRPLDYQPTQNEKVWKRVFVFGAGGGGGTVEPTTDLLEGDGAGNAIDSGIAADQVVLKQPLYPTPTTLFEIITCLQTAGLCAGGAMFSTSSNGEVVTPRSGPTIDLTTNLLEGDGSGNAIDSGIAAIDVCLKQPAYPTPTNAFEIIQCLQAAGLCA